MRNSLRLAMALLAIALLSATATGIASGNRLSLNSRTFRVVWSPFIFEGDELPEVPIFCNLSMEGSFHTSTIVKTLGALMGYVTRARLQNVCSRGEWWIHNGSENPLGRGVAPTSLPWHVTYEGFTGTLPRITGMLLLISEIKFSIHSQSAVLFFCLAVYGGPEENIIATAAIEAGGAITGLTPTLESIIRRKEFTAGCPARGRFIGTGTVTQLGTTATIVVRLI